METSKRSPNFSPQDNLLLAEIMSMTHPDFQDLELTYHQVDKHRFNSRISSSTKKALWKTVADRYNSSCSIPRDAVVLQKKWENLISKHRNLYSDYMRCMSMTGRGPTGATLSPLTEAVMACVGRSSVSVVGASGAAFDSSLNMIMNQQSNAATCSTPPVVKSATDFLELPLGTTVVDLCGSVNSQILPPVTAKAAVQRNSDCRCYVCSDPEMKALKKRKLELQIKFYERKLEE